MKAIVIGAGIGGLSAAIALRKAGMETVVFERARELKEVGAGLSLTANATAALNELGLAHALREIGGPVGRAEIRTFDDTCVAAGREVGEPIGRRTSSRPTSLAAAGTR